MLFQLPFIPGPELYYKDQFRQGGECYITIPKSYIIHTLSNFGPYHTDG